MQYKKSIKYLLIVLIMVVISACVSSKRPKQDLSDEQQAALYLKMGARYLEMDMLTIAKENLETAEEIDPDNANIHNALGALYERMNLLSEAREQYQVAIALDGTNFSTKNNYGRFLCDRGEYEAGIQLLNEVLAMPLNKRKWFAYTNVARCELRNGQQKEAEYNLRSALQINKNFVPALLEMQKISYHSEKYMSARAFLERYLGRAKHNADTLWYAVQTERALGDQKKAELYEDKLFSLFPMSKQARQLRIK